MPPELVYLLSNKLYLFLAYAAVYIAVAQGFSTAAVFAMPFVLAHATYVHTLEKTSLPKP